MKKVLVTFVFLFIFIGNAFAGVLLTYPKFQTFDSDGDPLVGGLLFTYVSGTTTKKATYSDSTLSTPNSNPIVLDSRGEATIYGDTGTYTLVLAPSTDSDPPTDAIWTINSVQLTPEGQYYLYPDASESDICASSTGGSLKDILTTLGTSKKATIKFIHSGSSNTTSYTCSTTYDASAYENVNFDFEKGAQLSIDSGITLTLYSPQNTVAAPSQQITSGSGTLAFSVPGVIYPDWWTENTTPGTTEMYSAINAAESACSSGGTIKFNGVSYLISTSLTTGSDINLDFTTQGAHISVASTKTLTMYSASNIIAPPNQQIFAGSGSFAYTVTDGTDFPERYGAETDTVAPAAGTQTANVTALNNCLQSGVGRVVLSGKYYTNTAVTAGSSLMELAGTGKTRSGLHVTDNTVHGLDYPNARGWLHDFTVQYDSADTGNAIDLSGTNSNSYIVLERVRAVSGNYGFDINRGATGITFIDCEAVTCDAAGWYTTGSGTSTAMVFDHCYSNNNVIGFYLNGVSTVKFIATVFNIGSNSTFGIQTNGTTSISASGTHLEGTVYNNNFQGIRIDPSIGNAFIDSTYVKLALNNSETGVYVFQFYATDDTFLTISGTSVADSTDSGIGRYKISGTANNTHLHLIGNYWNTITTTDIQSSVIETEPMPVTGIYDFSADGGTAGDYTLGSIPENAVITRAWYEVQTAFTSGGAATVALGVASDDASGILTATAYNNAAFTTGYHDATPDNTAANFTTETTDRRNVILTIADAALTAGKIRVFWEYSTTD